MVSLQYPIQVVARLTGLSPHVIRVWEKRYGVVVPHRTATRRRLYTEKDIDRLKCLAKATEAGHSIGLIAKLKDTELSRLSGENGVSVGNNGGGALDGGSPGGNGRVSSPAAAPSERVMAGRDIESGLVLAALNATREFSGSELNSVLERGALQFGLNGVLQRVVCPFARGVGELWQRGEMTSAHEHFASGQIRDFLARTTRVYGNVEGAPRAIVATPAGQIHELGAVIVAAAAAHAGWRVIYLGVSLPAAEIAGAALQNGARAVLLSLVYPADDRQIPGELLQLRRYLSPGTAIICGGRSAGGYAETLREISAVMPEDLAGLTSLLASLRSEGLGNTAQEAVR